MTTNTQFFRSGGSLELSGDPAEPEIFQLPYFHAYPCESQWKANNQEYMTLPNGESAQPAEVAHGGGRSGIFSRKGLLVGLLVITLVLDSSTRFRMSLP
jgi:hypothetical protein